MLSTTLSTVVLGAVAVSAATHRVEVGNGALRFNPARTSAEANDVVEFFFYARNHSVVQTAFNSPCISDSGFFSGFMPVASGTGNRTFQVTINDTKPIWFYCSQQTGNHCSSGMVGCINCPENGDRTVETFAASAANVTTPFTNPAAVNGGVFGVNSQNVSSTPTTPGNSGSPSGTSSPSPSGTNAGSALIPGSFGFGAILAAAAFML